MKWCDFILKRARSGWLAADVGSARAKRHRRSELGRGKRG
nr:MAG TPA_asm: hypothetical protein [Caudoviricetes sp.]